MQQVIFSYLRGLNNQQLKERISLLQQLQNEPEAKEIGTKYLNSLPKNELYTPDNLILLGQFTKSINEPGFQVFYNKESAKKVEAIIRQKKDYEKAKSKGFC